MWVGVALSARNCIGVVKQWRIWPWKGSTTGGKNWREGIGLDELQVDLFESKPPQHVPAPAWLLARVLTHGSHVDSLNLARIDTGKKISLSLTLHCVVLFSFL